MLVEYGIGTLVIGKNDGWKQNINIGKQNNQNFDKRVAGRACRRSEDSGRRSARQNTLAGVPLVSIPHARFIQQLEYKATLAGITVVITEESYTSRASFLDADEIPVHGKTDTKPKFSGRRVKRGLYKSKNNTLINADINGSANVMRKVFPRAFAEGIEGFVVNPARILAK